MVHQPLSVLALTFLLERPLSIFPSFLTLNVLQNALHTLITTLSTAQNVLCIDPKHSLRAEE